MPTCEAHNYDPTPHPDRFGKRVRCRRPAEHPEAHFDPVAILAWRREGGVPYRPGREETATLTVDVVPRDPKRLTGTRIHPVDPATPFDCAISESLVALQGVVEGYIERVTLPDGRVMVVNEEGIPRKLLPNHVASALLGTEIRGVVVVLDAGLDLP